MEEHNHDTDVYLDSKGETKLPTLEFRLTANAIYENRNVCFFVFECKICFKLFMQNEQNNWVEIS